MNTVQSSFSIVTNSQHIYNTRDFAVLDSVHCRDQIYSGGTQENNFELGCGRLGLQASPLSGGFENPCTSEIELLPMNPNKHDYSLPRFNNSLSDAGKAPFFSHDTEEDRILPAYFRPGPYSVIIGRGKESKGVIGNRRLRVIASTFLERYSNAPNKGTKSKIVATIVSVIREACPLGAFVRLGKDGRWYEVKDSVASEKVGYTLRELLGDNYRSSSRAKALRRALGNDGSVSEEEGSATQRDAAHAKKDLAGSKKSSTEKES